MTIPALIPFETCNLPVEVQLELDRRKTNRSFNYVKNEGWNPNGGDWQKYKGPMVAWTRVCSNGMGLEENNKPGFVFHGGKDFYKTYGFKWNQENNQQVIGYTPDGRKHIIENDINTSQYPIHVPTPEIVKVETVIQKELYRRAWIHWTCFSSKQLEYMTPYFLAPRISVVIEFGWNHFNMESLIDLTDEKKLTEYYFTNPYSLYKDNILKSNGNYDVVYGIITNYEFSIEGNKINCLTEVTSKDRLYSGVPISTVVAKRENPEDERSRVDYFADLRKICDTDFVKNLKFIATCNDLSEAESKVKNKQLLKLIKEGNTNSNGEMRREYWRGIFFGRNNKLIEMSSRLDYKWTVPKEGDFDKTGDDKNTWVNLGFLVELMNRSVPAPCPATGTGFFSVNVDRAVIGAHPNMISTDGNLLLIPNAFAPKYIWGQYGEAQHDANSDYINQYKPDQQKTISRTKEDKGDVFWHADYQLTNIFKQGQTPRRDDIDWVINAIRYIFPTERGSYSFPFSMDEEFRVKNREKNAVYESYFYGYFKDLYFNVNRFIELVKDESIKTYVDLYKAIFDDINKAGGNFWDLSLVQDDNISQLTVADNKMLPSGNNKSKPYYFDYLDSDSLLKGISFKPKMSDAQAFRAVYGENNNKNSKTVIKEENELINYNFYDRILSKMENRDPIVHLNPDPQTDSFKEQISILQNQTPKPDSYQFTVMVGNKPYFRRLVLPDSELLNCLLDDRDVERNGRYTGIQPITVELELQGIGGIRTFMVFLLRNLPKPYYHKDVAYRIVDVHHVIQEGKWDTVVKAGIIPLRDYIKTKIGIPE